VVATGVLGLLLAFSVSSCAYRPAPHLEYDVDRGIVLPAAPDDRAQVVFFYSSAPNVNSELAIYHGRDQVGLLRYIKWFSILVAPGDHRFGVVSVRSADFTVGNLAAGKTYFLEARLIFDDRFKLEPVAPTDSRYGGPLSNFMKGLYRVSPNSLTAGHNESLNSSRRNRFDTYLEKWQTKPEADRRRIPADHAVAGPISFRLDETTD
jgi:hypothetical protein